MGMTSPLSERWYPSFSLHLEEHRHKEKKDLLTVFNIGVFKTSIHWRTYFLFLEYSDEMREYGPIHLLWSASEEDLADTLKGVASCIDKCCKATEKRMSGLSEALLPVVHEYVLYSEMLMVRRPRCNFTLVADRIISVTKAVSLSVVSPLSFCLSRMLCIYRYPINICSLCEWMDE